MRVLTKTSHNDRDIGEIYELEGELLDRFLTAGLVVPAAEWSYRYVAPVRATDDVKHEFTRVAPPALTLDPSAPLTPGAPVPLTLDPAAPLTRVQE